MKKLAAVFGLTLSLLTAPATAQGIYQLELLWEIHMLSTQCVLVDDRYLAFKLGTAKELEAAGFSQERLAGAATDALNLMSIEAMDGARCNELVRPLMTAYLATLE